MKRILLFVYSSILLTFHSQSQDRFELQAYVAPSFFLEYILSSDGPLESIGLSAEYYFKENQSIGISMTFNQDKSSLTQYIRSDDIGIDGVYAYEIHSTNWVTNLIWRRYIDLESGNKLLIGGYLRYWQHNYARQNTDSYAAEYKDYFDFYDMPYTYIDHKVSLGVITGFKKVFANNITAGINLGGGISPTFLYFSQEEHFDTSKNGIRNYGENWDLDHLSFFNQVIVGYRF